MIGILVAGGFIVVAFLVFRNIFSCDSWFLQRAVPLPFWTCLWEYGTFIGTVVACCVMGIVDLFYPPDNRIGRSAQVKLMIFLQISLFCSTYFVMRRLQNPGLLVVCRLGCVGTFCLINLRLHYLKAKQNGMDRIRRAREVF